MKQLLEFMQAHEEAFRSRSRLASLYSDFRFQRQTNPDGYQANASAWLKALTAAAKEGLLPSQSRGQNDHFVLHTGGELERALQTQELGKPLALGAVIEDAVRKKDLIPVKDFLDAKQSVYAKSWIPTPWQVLTWGLRQLGVTGMEVAEDRLMTGDFVIVASVEAAAKVVLDQFSKAATSNSSRVFSRELFTSALSSTPGADSLSRTDISVLLTHLARDRSAIAYSPSSGTIKFKAASEASASDITQEDVTIASLRTLITSLEPQVQELMKRISDLETVAREAVSKKQVTVAKSALRSKKLIDARLQQRTATLAQLEEVYAKIEQAHDQVEIVRVMEASSQTLRTLNKRTGGVEKVQDVMDGLKEEMTNVDEIQQAINEVSSGAVDELEVDDELEALEKMEQERQEATERKEQEAEEKEEAEKTRRKLAELDQLGKKDSVEETSEPTSQTAQVQIQEQIASEQPP